MKTLFLFTLAVIISTSLNARENPFEATNAYEEEAARIIELNESTIEEAMQEEQYIKEMQEKMSKASDDANKNKVEEAVNKIVPVIEEKPVEKTYSKTEVDKLIKKTKIQTENRTKQIVKKEIEKNKTLEPTQVVYVKPRPDVVDEDAMLTKELLDFIKVEFNDNKLIIHTDYKVSKKFTIDKENKIIIDYKSKINFYTKREDLESKYFKKIAVGNHKKEQYFRVVVELLDNPTNYKVSYKDKLITISRIN